MPKVTQLVNSRAACSCKLNKYVPIALIPNMPFITIFVMLLFLTSSSPDYTCILTNKELLEDRASVFGV